MSTPNPATLATLAAQQTKPTLLFPLFPEAGFGTRCIHGGQLPDPITGAVTTPISLATTFVQRAPGEHTGYEYSRTGNPTRHTFEAAIASVEGGTYGLAFASGSATTASIIHLLQPGDHVISVDDVYGGTNRFFQRVATPNQGIQVSFVDCAQPADALAASLKEALTEKTRLIWVETPTNPTLKLVDIKEVAKFSKAHNLILAVDNTFATPALQNPLALGADIVVHSVTKYLGGHSDVVMGVLATNSVELFTKLKFIQNSVGSVPSPFDSYLALRGLKTLHLRMKAHSENAMAVAEFLSAHPNVERVVYPGLPSHPQHELAKRQMKGFGGMVTFYLRGGIEESRTFLSSLQLFALAESLGAVESLAEHPAIMTHASVPTEQRVKLGIADNMVRLSVGVENIEDILADLSTSLAAINTANKTQ